MSHPFDTTLESRPITPMPPTYDLLELVLEAENGAEDDFVYIMEARTYDDEGDEIVAEEAEKHVLMLHTCRDQGEDIIPALRTQVEANLRAVGITWRELSFVWEYLAEDD